MQPRWHTAMFKLKSNLPNSSAKLKLVEITEQGPGSIKKKIDLCFWLKYWAFHWGLAGQKSSIQPANSSCFSCIFCNSVDSWSSNTGFQDFFPVRKNDEFKVTYTRCENHLTLPVLVGELLTKPNVGPQRNHICLQPGQSKRGVKHQLTSDWHNANQNIAWNRSTHQNDIFSTTLRQRTPARFALCKGSHLAQKKFPPGSWPSWSHSCHHHLTFVSSAHGPGTQKDQLSSKLAQPRDGGWDMNRITSKTLKKCSNWKVKPTDMGGPPSHATRPAMCVHIPFLRAALRPTSRMITGSLGDVNFISGHRLTTHFERQIQKPQK